MESPSHTAGGLYKNWESRRDTFLERARDCAEFTIPSLLPRSGHSDASVLETPWQGTGARGVNNLASKLLLALFPPNSPFFRLRIDDATIEALAGSTEVKAGVEEGLAKIERSVMDWIESNAIRVSVFEALKHLIVTGNVLLYLPKEGGMRVFHMNRFCVARDSMGNVLQIIVKEDLAPGTLPPNVASIVEGPESEQQQAPTGGRKDIELFTHIRRDATTWKVHQEVMGQKVPGTEGSYPLDKTPWVPVRWTKIDGEDYGRSYVEEYLGDLRSLEGLSQAIVEGSAAASKVLFMVHPNGVTKKKDIVEAENGAVVSGVKEEVSVLQMEKYSDFRIALETMNKIDQRLSYAFLLNSSVQRGGERVTAEEIRYMAGELEDALGGIYSILSLELQLPIVNRVMHVMERAKKLPTLPDGVVKPVIVTGLEALGRGHDLTKLNTFLQQIAVLGPEVVAEYVDVSNYLTRVGTGLGFDTKGLVRTQEEVDQRRAIAQQQAMQQMMLEKGIAPAITQGGQMMQKGMDQQNDPQAQAAQ